MIRLLFYKEVTGPGEDRLLYHMVLPHMSFLKCFEHSPYLLCNTSSPTQGLWVGLQFTTGFYNSFQLLVRPKAVNNWRAVKCTVKCFCLCIVLHIGQQQIKFLYRYQKIQTNPVLSVQVCLIKILSSSRFYLFQPSSNAWNL